MEENILDMRGRPSPEPLVEARRVIGAGDAKSFVVLITDARCADNLSLLAASVGWSSRVERTTEGDLRVAMRARRGGVSGLMPAALHDAEAASEAAVAPQVALAPRTVVLLASLRVGEGELGEQILKNFVLALPHTPLPPDAVVLLNDAARLIEESSGVSAALEALTKQGTTIWIGAACVERFGLAHQLRFAKPVAMTELAALLLSAERVIRF